MIANVGSLLKEQYGGKMAKLTMGHRKNLLKAGKSNFAIPSKAPASGSYPINDRSHAINALARSSGKPVAAEVRAKVRAKFPSIGHRKNLLKP